MNSVVRTRRDVRLTVTTEKKAIICFLHILGSQGLIDCRTCLKEEVLEVVGGVDDAKHLPKKLFNI